MYSFFLLSYTVAPLPTLALFALQVAEVYDGRKARRGKGTEKETGGRGGWGGKGGKGKKKGKGGYHFCEQEGAPVLETFNPKLSALFRQVGTIYGQFKMKDEDTFRAMQFEKAAKLIDSLPWKVTAKTVHRFYRGSGREKKDTRFRGVGPTMITNIEKWVETGTFPRLAALKDNDTVRREWENGRGGNRVCTGVCTGVRRREQREGHEEKGIQSRNETFLVRTSVKSNT